MMHNSNSIPPIISFFAFAVQETTTRASVPDEEAGPQRRRQHRHSYHRSMSRTRGRLCTIESRTKTNQIFGQTSI